MTAGEPRAEAGLLDIEVGAGERQFLIERRPLRVGAAQRVAEHLGQLLDGGVGAGRVGVNQRGDGVERVEQEVRVDLRAQRLQLRAARLQAQLAGHQLLLLPLVLQPQVSSMNPNTLASERSICEVLAEQPAPPSRGTSK
jgi:hypothetical protein